MSLIPTAFGPIKDLCSINLRPTDSCLYDIVAQHRRGCAAFLVSNRELPANDYTAIQRPHTYAGTVPLVDANSTNFYVSALYMVRGGHTQAQAYPIGST